MILAVMASPQSRDDAMDATNLIQGFIFSLQAITGSNNIIKR